MLASHSTRRFNGPPGQTVRQARRPTVTQRLGRVCVCVLVSWRNVAAWDCGRERHTMGPFASDRQTRPADLTTQAKGFMWDAGELVALPSSKGKPPRPIGRASSQPRNLSKTAGPRNGLLTGPGPQHPAGKVVAVIRPDERSEAPGGPSLRPAFGRPGRPPHFPLFCQLREAEKQRKTEALAFCL